jgi:hypothetical protein
MSPLLAVPSPWSMSLSSRTLSSLFWNHGPLRGTTVRPFILMASTPLRTIPGGQAIQRASHNRLASAAVITLRGFLTPPRWIILLLASHTLNGETLLCGRVRVACAPSDPGSLPPRVRKGIGPFLISVGGPSLRLVSLLWILILPPRLTFMSNRVVPRRRLGFPFSVSLRRRSTGPFRAFTQWNVLITSGLRLWRPHSGRPLRNKYTMFLSSRPFLPPRHKSLLGIICDGRTLTVIPLIAHLP